MLNSKILEAEELANKYRNSLDQVRLSDQEVYNYLNKRNYLNKNLNKHAVRVDRLLESRNENYYIKETQGYLYYHFKLLNAFGDYLKEKQNAFNVSLVKLKRDRIELQDSFDSINLKLTNSYTQSYKKSIFKERGVKDKISLLDRKSEKYFLESYQCNYKNLIESPVRQIEKIFPKKCYISEATKSDTFTKKVEEISSDPNYIFRKDKTFKYIISKKQIKRNNIQVKDLEATLEVVFLFDRIETINEIFLDLGSSLPVILEKDDLSYYNNTSDEWLPVETTFYYESFNNKKYFINEIKTNKFKLKLSQRKSYSDISVSGNDNLNSLLLENNMVESNSEEQEVIKIFDLSIDNIDFFYKSYKQKGFYRESEYFEANELKELNLKTEERLPENCYIEKEIEIIKLFNGEKVFQVFVPVSENDSYEEVLIFKKRRALITFPSDDVDVSKNGISLVRGRDYQLRIEGENQNIASQCYSCSIELKETVSMSVEDIFVCRSLIKFPVNFNRAISIDHSSVYLNNYEEAQYLISPRFVFRNLSKNNKSGLIKNYTLSVISSEKKNLVDKKFKRLETTEIMETNNV